MHACISIFSIQEFGSGKIIDVTQVNTLGYFFTYSGFWRWSKSNSPMIVFWLFCVWKDRRGMERVDRNSQVSVKSWRVFLFQWICSGNREKPAPGNTSSRVLVLMIDSSGRFSEGKSLKRFLAKRQDWDSETINTTLPCWCWFPQLLVNQVFLMSSYFYPELGLFSFAQIAI